MNNNFNLKQYLSEGKLLNEIEVGTGRFERFYKDYLDNEIEIWEDLNEEDVEEEMVNYLKNERNNIPLLSDLLSLAKKIQETQHTLEDMSGDAYPGEFHSDLVYSLKRDTNPQSFPEIDDLIDILNDLHNNL